MKPLTLLCTFLCLAFFVKAQDTVHLKHEAKVGKVITDRPPQAVYAELGGSGILLSANYDRRFSNKTTGLGFRVGLGYSFGTYPNFITLPVGINYLLGKRSSFFELGVGETLVLLGEQDKGEFGIGDLGYTSSTTVAITTLTVGYRLQPVKGGFNFRAGLTPMVAKGGAAVLPYLSFGYNF